MRSGLGGCAAGIGDNGRLAGKHGGVLAMGSHGRDLVLRMDGVVLEPNECLITGDRPRGRARSQMTACTWGLALVLLMLACTAFAQTAPALKVGLYEPAGATVPHAVGQLSRFAFREMPPGPLQLQGKTREVHWLRLEMNLPPLADDDARWVLWFDRVRVDRLALHWPDASPLAPIEPVDFFAPSGGPAAHAGGYGFTIPRGLKGPVTLYVEAVGQGSFNLFPRLRTEPQIVALDRNAVVVYTAVYTGVALLMLIGLGMYIALRDRLYLYYLFYLGALLAFLLASNGHLYELPWIGQWGHWRTLGLYALANVLAAATVVLARGFAGLPRSASGVDRLLALFPAIPLTLFLVCLLNRSGSAWAVQIATTAVVLLAMLLAALATAMAWRFKRHLALPMLLMWLLLFAAGCVRAFGAYGIVPNNGWTQYGYQVIAALNALLLGFVLSDRIIEFRLQRDRARLAKDQVDASLRIERERRKFIESLHTGLREAPGGDQEWMAFRRLLEALRQLVPQHSSAVALHAFHGNDLLLCEPHSVRDDYQTLLATRGGAFKGISRSQLPMQLRIDAPTPLDGTPAELLQYAVLPLPLIAPAWGVLLIERRGWQAFDHDELELAAELAQKATRAAMDAASDRALRRSAEFDSLTGAFNRRTVDVRLDACFKQAIAANAPLAVLFVDLDHLKNINDVHGHAAGDRCLCALAEALSAQCEADGLFGRYGGDEFVVVLPDFNPERARAWAEGLRAEVTSQDHAFASGTLRLRVSIGVANRMPADSEVRQLVERADKALYSAKRMGRDQVQAAASHGVVRGIGTH